MNSIAMTAAGSGEFRRSWRALLAAVVGMAFRLMLAPLAGAIGPLLLIVLKPGESYRLALLVFAAFSLTSAGLLGTLGACPR